MDRSELVRSRNLMSADLERLLNQREVKGSDNLEFTIRVVI